MSFIGKIRSNLPGNIGGASGKSNTPKVPIDTVDLAKAGVSAMDDVDALYKGDKIRAGKKFIKSIKNQSQNQNEVVLAKTALKVPGSSKISKAKAFETTLRVLGSGVPAPIGTTLSLIGRSICTGPFCNQKASVLKPYMEAIRDNSNESNEVILVQTALNVKGGSPHDPREDAYKTTLETIQNGVSGKPAAFVLAETGLGSFWRYSHPKDRIKVSKPFIEAIAKHAPANSKEAEIAQKTLAVPATKDSYQIYENALKEVYDLLKPTPARKNIAGVEKMIKQYKEKKESESSESSGTDMKIVVEEETVNIGGIELPRRVYKLIG